MLRVEVDIGGTHTDLVMIDETRGAITVHKIATTVADPSAGTVEALVELCGMAGVDTAAIDYFMHGTTVATNIALEHNGAKTGLITTAGFRDILHIARHKRPQTFSLQLDLPWQTHPLVPRRRRIGVKERIVPPGDVLCRSMKQPRARRCESSSQEASRRSRSASCSRSSTPPTSAVSAKSSPKKLPACSCR